MPSGFKEILRCSFCNKPQEDVRKLIAGPSVFICDECIDVCRNIIADDLEQAPNGLEAPLEIPKGPPGGSPVQCVLCGTWTPCGDVIFLPNRGVLCLGCVGEVEAAVAERRQAAG